MTSSSPEARFVEAFPRSKPAAADPAGPAAGFTAAHPVELPVTAHALPAEAPAGSIRTARFDVDLREQPSLPGDLADRLRADAHAAGYASGWAQGRREAEVAARAARDQVEAQVRRSAADQAGRVGQALVALVAAADGLERRMVPVAADLEDTVTGLAFEIARMVIGRELVTATEPGRDAIARALAYAPAGRPVAVRLHPTDYATVTSEQPALVEIEGRTVSLSADGALRPGDAVAESDATTIDARLGPALERVREVLGL
jgi:flagellar assembly protein FliH